eukprot:TRINITY_DN77703_c0_g1_i1.p2 TRINITY_DN77703_c0_g1~~TRINITY_DN77703_c0_g1_i1.p2  ORF type:complete len:170 (+),score=42.89 TRINITY_DN77703_c0_g1_i1:41-550(+)
MSQLVAEAMQQLSPMLQRLAALGSPALADGVDAALQALHAAATAAEAAAAAQEPCCAEVEARLDRIAAGGRTFETCIRHLALLDDLKPYELLLLGDSHVERFQKRVHGGPHFVQLEKSAGRSFAAGVGGDGVAELRWRLREQRLLHRFPRTPPLRAVVILIGANDLLRP